MLLEDIKTGVHSFPARTQIWKYLVTQTERCKQTFKYNTFILKVFSVRSLQTISTLYFLVVVSHFVHVLLTLDSLSYCLLK